MGRNRNQGAMPGQAPAGSPSPASAVNRPDPSPSAREQQQATRTKHLTNHPSDREKAPLPLSSQLLSRAPNERSLPVSGTVPPPAQRHSRPQILAAPPARVAEFRRRRGLCSAIVMRQPLALRRTCWRPFRVPATCPRHGNKGKKIRIKLVMLVWRFQVTFWLGRRSCLFHCPR